MRIIGVTGGVGSGKSAVLNYIEEHFDSRIVKADDVGHLLMMPGRACYEPVIQLFGEWIVKDDTSLNREAIASIVFEDGEMLKKLDDIIHPAVKKYILKEIEKSKKEETEFFFIESALLLEEKYDEICDELWYIYADEEVRKERLIEGRGYSEKKVREIMANQLSEDEFSSHCDFEIDNSGDFEETKKQLDHRMKKYETL